MSFMLDFIIFIVKLSVIMVSVFRLKVTMLCAVILGVFMLSVVAPFKDIDHRNKLVNSQFCHFVPSVVFTRLHFVCNLPIGPIS
jgi:hypothetical protein